MPVTVADLQGRLTLDTSGFRRGLSDAQGQLQGFLKALGPVGQIAAGFAAGQVAAVALVGAFRTLKVATVDLATAALEANVQFTRWGNTLRVATGSAEGAADALEFVRRTTQRLGTDLKSSADQFAQLAAAALGTRLEGQAIRDVFVATSQAVAVLGLSATQTSGVLNALQQMVSKGNVQTQELRIQLGNNLPGAMQIAARAMGVTTAELSKMIEEGQVATSDFLPKFARELNKTFGTEAANAAAQFQASRNRLSNEILELQKDLGDFLQSPAQRFTDWLSASTRLTREFLSVIGTTPRSPLQQITDPFMRNIPTGIAQAAGAAAFEQAMIPRTALPPEPLSPNQQAALDALKVRLAEISAIESERPFVKLANDLKEFVDKAGPARAEAQKLADQILALSKAARNPDRAQAEINRILTEQAMTGVQAFLDAEETATQEELKLLAEMEGRAREAGSTIASIWAAMAQDQIDAEEGAMRENIARLDEMEAKAKEAGSTIASIWAQMAQDQIDAEEAAMLAVSDQVEPLRELERSQQSIGRTSSLLGRDFDALNATIHAQERALRDLVERGLDPADSRVQDLAASLRALQDQRDLRDSLLSVFDSVGRAIDTLVQGVIQGTQTMEQAFRNLGQAIVAELVNTVIQQALNPLKRALSDVLSGATTGTATSLSGLASSAATGGTASLTSAAGGVAMGAAGSWLLSALGGAGTAAAANTGSPNLQVLGGAGAALYNSTKSIQAVQTAVWLYQQGYSIPTIAQALSSSGSLSAGAGVLGGALSVAGGAAGNQQLSNIGASLSAASYILPGATAAGQAAGAIANVGLGAYNLSQGNTYQGIGQLVGTVIGGIIGTFAGGQTLAGAALGGAAGGSAGSQFDRYGIGSTLAWSRAVSGRDLNVAVQALDMVGAPNWVSDLLGGDILSLITDFFGIGGGRTSAELHAAHQQRDITSTNAALSSLLGTFTGSPASLAGILGGLSRLPNQASFSVGVGGQLVSPYGGLSPMAAAQQLIATPSAFGGTTLNYPLDQPARTAFQTALDEALRSMAAAAKEMQDAITTALDEITKAAINPPTLDETLQAQADTFKTFLTEVGKAAQEQIDAAHVELMTLTDPQAIIDQVVKIKGLIEDRYNTELQLVTAFAQQLDALTASWRQTLGQIEDQIAALKLGPFGGTNPSDALALSLSRFQAAQAAFQANATPETAARVSQLVDPLLQAASQMFDRPSSEFQAIFAQALAALEDVQSKGQTILTSFNDALTAVIGEGNDLQALTAANTAKIATEMANLHADAITVFQSLGFFTGPSLPQFASGTSYVPKTGLALVHEGEAIVPKGETMARGLSVVINVSGAGDPKAVAEEIERRLLTGALGRKVLYRTRRGA